MHDLPTVTDALFYGPPASHQWVPGGEAPTGNLDAVRMREVLTAPTGMVKRTQSALIDPAADSDSVFAAIADFFDQAAPEDVRLLYLSGHTVELRPNSFHFTTCGYVQPTADEAPARVRNQIPIRRIVDELIAPSAGERVILIVDSCHPAAWTDALNDACMDSKTVPKTVELLTYPLQLTAVPNDPARRLGPLTAAYLAAAASTDRLPTLTTSALPEALAGNGAWTRIPLGRSSDEDRAPEPIALCGPAAESTIGFRSPDHHLDDALCLLDDILCNARANPSRPMTARIADALRTVAFGGPDSRLSLIVMEQGSGGWSPSRHPLDDSVELANHARFATDMLNRLPKELPGFPGRTSAAILPAGEWDQPGEASMAIHLAGTSNPQVLFLSRIPSTSPLLASLLCTLIVGSVIRHAAAVTSVEQLQSAVLDDVRRTSGRLPANHYRERFRLFEAELEAVDMWFQPIIQFPQIDLRHYDDGVINGGLYIKGWEALARGPVTLDGAPHRSPGAILDVAELWGAKFMARLDVDLLIRATTDFTDQAKALDARANIDLSVNCYPESMVRREFEGALIQAKLLASRCRGMNLILEISEKCDLPVIDQLESGFPGGTRSEFDRAEAFREYLKQMRDRVGNFEIAIDDFGSGRSSTIRTVGLKPHSIKIDRSVLIGRKAATTLNYVSKLAAVDFDNSSVVVEGWDSESTLSLREILAAGPRCIQGNEIMAAQPDIVNELGSIVLHRVSEEFELRR